MGADITKIREEYHIDDESYAKDKSFFLLFFNHKRALKVYLNAKYDKENDLIILRKESLLNYYKHLKNTIVHEKFTLKDHSIKVSLQGLFHQNKNQLKILKL